VGVSLEGPSRVGHYFRPYAASAKGTRADPGKGPVLVPDGKPRSWTLAYDPDGNQGRGTLRVKLDGEEFAYDLPPGFKAEGAALDRFGLFSVRAGGMHVKV